MTRYIFLLTRLLCRIGFCSCLYENLQPLQLTTDGQVVNEKEWRRQNIEWERRRRDAEKDAEFRHQREVDKRRARMCLRQQQREADYRKMKAEKARDINAAVKVG